MWMVSDMAQSMIRMGKCFLKPICMMYVISPIGFRRMELPPVMDTKQVTVKVIIITHLMIRSSQGQEVSGWLLVWGRQRPIRADTVY